MCRPEPWNDLQLPDGHKRLIQSLIESHSSKQGPRNLHFDLIRAKGDSLSLTTTLPIGSQLGLTIFRQGRHHSSARRARRRKDVYSG